MAEAFLKSFDNHLEVYSAGTEPCKKIHPLTIKVMDEKGFDLSRNQPKSVDKFLTTAFDFVITVCNGAKESCPVFTGKVTKHIHIGFNDPAEAKGTEKEKLKVFRRVRNEIFETFQEFYRTIIKNKNNLDYFV